MATLRTCERGVSSSRSEGEVLVLTDDAAGGVVPVGDVTVSARSVGQEVNTLFWRRVRRRGRRRWQQILREAGRNSFVGLASLGWMCVVLWSSHSTASAAPLTAAPLSGANIIALGGGLTGFVAAIWVAVAVQPGSDDHSLQSAAAGSMLVRLQVLMLGARVLSVAMTLLAGGSLIWYSGLPSHLDLVRTLPVIAGAVLVLVIAADAVGLAADPEGKGLDRFRKVDPLMRTSETLHGLGVDPDADTAGSVARGVLLPRRFIPALVAVLGVPLVAVAISEALVPSSEQFWSRFAVAAACSIAAYVGWVVLSYLIADGQLFEAVALVVITTLIVVLVIVGVVSVVAGNLAAVTPWEAVRVLLAVALTTTLPLVVHGFGAIPRRAPHGMNPYRNAVVTFAAVLLLRRHGKQLRALQKSRKLAVDRLAIIACILMFPVPPAALLLANVAAARLRSAPGVRGRGLALVARWGSVLVLMAPLVVLLLWASASELLSRAAPDGG